MLRRSSGAFNLGKFEGGMQNRRPPLTTQLTFNGVLLGPPTLIKMPDGSFILDFSEQRALSENEQASIATAKAPKAKKTRTKTVPPRSESEVSKPSDAVQLPSVRQSSKVAKRKDETGIEGGTEL
jgi:hypothetical protein